MAPPKQQQPVASFSENERVLCFHLEMLYEAKVLEVKRSEEDPSKHMYKIHYKGWKSSWDDWVTEDRIRKFTDENRELASTLAQQSKALHAGKSGNKPPKGKGVGGRGAGSDLSSARGSEERAAGTTTQSGRGPRRARDFELEPEEDFHKRPSIKLPLPDLLKGLLVDDWENVTKNQQLVPLPHPHPVNKILNDYLEYERPNRVAGSASLDVLEETIAGIREYFDKCLGRILLYRFERNQFLEFHEQWQASGDDGPKGPGDVYGAEHLARLLANLPELIAQTNMDHQSVNRLREELIKFTTWFSKKAVEYFVSEYETPSQEYADKARAN